MAYRSACSWSVRSGRTPCCSRSSARISARPLITCNVRLKRTGSSLGRRKEILLEQLFPLRGVLRVLFGWVFLAQDHFLEIRQIRCRHVSSGRRDLLAVARRGLTLFGVDDPQTPHKSTRNKPSSSPRRGSLNSRSSNAAS